MDILAEDDENACYGSERMYDALVLRGYAGLPGTVETAMNANGLGPGSNRRKPNSLMKEDKAVQKADDLLDRDFTAEMPNSILITDLTEVP
jgi:hypothetical protein